MKNIKKLTAVALSVLLILSCSLTALAEERPFFSDPGRFRGDILEVEGDTLTLSMDGVTETIYLMDETHVINAGTGRPMELEDRTTDFASIYYYTPETDEDIDEGDEEYFAVIIICDFPPEYTGPFYGQAEGRTRGEEGELIISLDRGAVFLTIPDDIPITSRITGEAATGGDIQEGTGMLFWTEEPTAYPSDETAARIVILNRDEIRNQHYYMVGNLFMVPLRPVAEAMGYSLSWDRETQTATLAKNGLAFEVTAGSDIFEEWELDAAPVIRGGTLFVPGGFFRLLLEAEAEALEEE